MSSIWTGRKTKKSSQWVSTFKVQPCREDERIQRKELNQEFLPRHHWGLLIRCQKLWKLSGEALSIYALQIKTWRFTPGTTAWDTVICHHATFGYPWTTTSHRHLHANHALIFKKNTKCIISLNVHWNPNDFLEDFVHESSHKKSSTTTGIKSLRDNGE